MSLKFIMGYTDAETVMLDFDNTSFQKVKYWASLTLKRFKLGGFLVLKSSENCYHVVFDRTVSWAENMSIVAWVSLLSHNEKLRNWLTMQCIKKESTLRISPKRDKPSPRIVYRHRKQDEQIKDFLYHRRLVKNIARRIHRHSTEI